MSLVLGSRDFGDDSCVVMAIVNRTPDSFYDRGATYGDPAALERVAEAVAEGAEIVDIGGVKAGYGDHVDEREEIRRTATLVERVR
ncbi:MAG: dihydropteroate synthase, partial [Nocardioidaceae bacterium]|nr:dihydropteroate synthase [Nocardioidaceae bacterium]